MIRNVIKVIVERQNDIVTSLYTPQVAIEDLVAIAEELLLTSTRL